MLEDVYYSAMICSFLFATEEHNSIKQSINILLTQHCKFVPKLFFLMNPDYIHLVLNEKTFIKVTLSNPSLLGFHACLRAV